MQMNINEHDKNMMKVTMTLERQIEEKNETIDRYKEVLKRKREQADIEKKKIKDTFEKEKKDADKHRELGLAEQALQIQKMSEQESDINDYYHNIEEKKSQI